MQAGDIVQVSSRSGPTFHVIGRQPIRPAAVLLALCLFVLLFSSIGYGLRHSRRHHGASAGGANRSGTGADADGDNEQDDPSQVDVVYVGDAGDAPEPPRQGKHVYRAVHPTIMVHLPRFGPQQGLIPDDDAGHLLYRWLAAFNQASAPALSAAVPTSADAATVSAMLLLRQQTGGLRLLYAQEISPGLLVFRLQDQTPAAGEVLGTLQVRPKSDPAGLQSFSLRSVPAVPPAKAGVSP